jgi:hypothetical protein
MIDYQKFYIFISDIATIIQLGEQLQDEFTELNKQCKDCEQCCCRHCADERGYFYRCDEDYEFFMYSNFMYSNGKKLFGFNKEKGFLTETGCALPRYLRSRVCLGFVCFKFEEKLKERNDFFHEVDKIARQLGDTRRKSFYIPCKERK